MKIMLIGVHYCEGKYRPTKTVEKMLTSVGHELVGAPSEGVTICVGRLMPFEAPKKPDSLLKAESLKLAQTDLDALMGLQAADNQVVIPELAAKPKKQKRQKPKAKGKRAKKGEAPAQETAEAA